MGNFYRSISKVINSFLCPFYSAVEFMNWIFCYCNFVLNFPLSSFLYFTSLGRLYFSFVPSMFEINQWSFFLIAAQYLLSNNSNISVILVASTDSPFIVSDDLSSWYNKWFSFEIWTFWGLWGTWSYFNLFFLINSSDEVWQGKKVRHLLIIAGGMEVQDSNLTSTNIWRWGSSL